MNSTELDQLCKTYHLDPLEIACILLWFTINNKTLAFSYTIGLNSKSKNKEVLGQRFFHRTNVQEFIASQKNNFVNNSIEYQKTFDIETIQDRTVLKQQPDIDIEITSENIKQILQSEFQSIKDPDKRAVILMKIADFVGLKNSDQDDPLTPTIYLPARCSQCKQLTTKQ